MTRLTPYLLSAPAAALLAGLLLGPLVLLVSVSLYETPAGRGFFTPGTWTLQNYDAHSWQLVGFTILFGTGVAVLAVAAAYPVALVIRSLPGRWRAAAVALVLLPKLASPLVVLFGLQQLLGGWSVPLTRNLFGAVVGEAYLILPYAVLILFLQLRRIDPAVEAAARGLGASAWQTFRRVTLPLSVPGLVLAGELALVWGLAAFLGPLFLGGPAEATLSVEVHRQAFEYGRWPRSAALAVVLLAIAGGCLAAYAILTRRGRRT